VLPRPSSWREGIAAPPQTPPSALGLRSWPQRKILDTPSLNASELQNKMSTSSSINMDYAKRSFYRAANVYIFGKIGRLASQEVILRLIVSKCMPMLLFGLEACTLNKSQLSLLDFTINIFFMKLFQTNSIEIVRACQESFGFEVPSVLLKKRTEKLEMYFHALNLCS